MTPTKDLREDYGRLSLGYGVKTLPVLYMRGRSRHTFLFWLLSASMLCAQTGTAQSTVSRLRAALQGFQGNEVRGIPPAPPDPTSAGSLNGFSVEILASTHALEADLASDLAPSSYPLDASGVLVLPKIVISSGKAAPESTEVRSRIGLQQLFLQRYPGASLKNQDPVHSVIPNYAALMYKDDLRLERMKELNRLQKLLGKPGASPEARELKKEVRDAFIRRPTWQEEGMDKSYNNGRR